MSAMLAPRRQPYDGDQFHWLSYRLSRAGLKRYITEVIFLSAQ